MTKINSRSNLEALDMAPGITAWIHYDTPSLSVAEVEFSTGAEEPLHYHHKATQVFTVMQGQGTFIFNGVVHQLKPGDTITADPKVPHHAKNTGTEKLVVQVVSHPTATGDREVVS